MLDGWAESSEVCAFGFFLSKIGIALSYVGKWKMEAIPMLPLAWLMVWFDLLVRGCLHASWAMKSFQGLVKSMIGCWTRLETTLVYTKGKMWEWLWSSRSPKGHILRPALSSDMVQRVLWWERQKRCFSIKKRKKGRGPWQRNDIIIKF